MIAPLLKALTSPDLQEPTLPADPTDCEVLVELAVGPPEGGQEVFSLTVVTPAALARVALPRWGRGKLIVSRFDWAEVRRAVERLLSHAARDTWHDVAVELNKELGWEFEGYDAG
jgi:hypothetical protein